MTFAPKNVSILRFQCGHQCMREGGVTCHLEHRHYRIDSYHDHEHNISVCFFFWGGGAHLGLTISPPKKYIFHLDFYHAIMDLVGNKTSGNGRWASSSCSYSLNAWSQPWWALALPSAVAPGHGKHVSYIRFGRDGLVSKSTMNLW